MPQFVGVYGSAAGAARGRPLGNRREGHAMDRSGASVSDSTLQNLVGTRQSPLAGRGNTSQPHASPLSPTPHSPADGHGALLTRLHAANGSPLAPSALDLGPLGSSIYARESTSDNIVPKFLRDSLAAPPTPPHTTAFSHLPWPASPSGGPPTTSPALPPLRDGALSSPPASPHSPSSPYASAQYHHQGVPAAAAHRRCIDVAAGRAASRPFSSTGRAGHLSAGLHRPQPEHGVEAGGASRLRGWLEDSLTPHVDWRQGQPTDTWPPRRRLATWQHHAASCGGEGSGGSGSGSRGSSGAGCFPERRANSSPARLRAPPADACMPQGLQPMDAYSSLAQFALDHRLQRRCFSAPVSPSQSERIREVTEALSTPPLSLYFDRGEIPIPPDLDNPLGRAMIKIMGFESKRSKLLHGAQRLYGAVTEHVDSGTLQKAFQTGSMFWSSYVLLSLHVWMVVRRLLHVQHPDVRFFRQRFYNQFQQDVEYRVYAAGVQVGVSKWLKRLEEHFYETAYEFDDVLTPGSGKQLADVMLRKYFGGNEAQRPNAELLARYTMRELQCLAITPEEAVLAGQVRFSGELAEAVARAGVTSPTEEAGPGAGAQAGPGGAMAGAEAGLAGGKS
ncbi:hypothetical protein HYH03_005306 [Edaphochlamys debaryana]|uniref:Ubiquinol-cytochrome c chaperone domain-containing protein n=1 Tax=Edaphochlamys debaryana TaxID=47281 RepID=A0A836C183_9CHLO|nr:hypothetical protein HYH03_005306 [Edaphochlamys debaryana]|eukprot:KAG2496480.1 hypothetical protein HYH03_005306 [Edaphochlamys debaryana]